MAQTAGSVVIVDQYAAHKRLVHAQCNHWRPTYVELILTDIERLFERS